MFTFKLPNFQASKHLSISVCVSLPAQPVQWNLFIPFHRDEISVALICFIGVTKKEKRG